MDQQTLVATELVGTADQPQDRSDMASEIELGQLLEACSDESETAAIKIHSALEPIGGPGATVKPAVYLGGTYQFDKRWESEDADQPAPVVVIDNVPSQANRLETAIQHHVAERSLPELVLDLAGVANFPAHLPRALSSWEFPHRNADAYLRDADLDGVQFLRTDLGRSIFDATPWAAEALMAWFPQALLYGFWQSHLGKKRANTKHARSWVSEIVGWHPATTETRVRGLKGDPIVLNKDAVVTSNEDDRQDWVEGKGRLEGGKSDRLSEMGHGPVPFPDEKLALAGVSFARITQAATLSFAQLRRISLGGAHGPEADAAARALLVALGVFGHVHAFGRGFALRSGADLVATATQAAWVNTQGTTEATLPTRDAAAALLDAAREHAESAGVPLDGWGREPVRLTPRENLAGAIRATWPLEDG